VDTKYATPKKAKENIPMRMIRKSAILVDIELIKHQEGVVVSKFRSTNRSTNSSANTFGLFLGKDSLDYGS
jgi:hypothetical protein